MNIKEAKKRHQELWIWLAKHPNKEKQNWPGWKNYSYIANYCFPCHIAEKDCYNCPIIWDNNIDNPDPDISCIYDANRKPTWGLFSQWYNTFDQKKAAILAIKIAQLPWKKSI